MRGQSDLAVYVNTIDAPEEVDSGGANIGLGGIDSTIGYSQNSAITVDNFVRGHIGSRFRASQDWFPTEHPKFDGSVTINSGMGPDTEIGTVQADSASQVRYDLAAHITINGDMGGRIASTGDIAPTTQPDIPSIHIVKDEEGDGNCTGVIETVPAPASSSWPDGGSIKGAIIVDGSLAGQINALRDRPQPPRPKSRRDG
jgi:hypothetical protein